MSASDAATGHRPGIVDSLGRTRVIQLRNAEQIRPKSAPSQCFRFACGGLVAPITCWYPASDNSPASCNDFATSNCRDPIRSLFPSFRPSGISSRFAMTLSSSGRAAHVHCQNHRGTLSKLSAGAFLSGVRRIPRQRRIEEMRTASRIAQAPPLTAGDFEQALEIKADVCWRAPAIGK